MNKSTYYLLALFVCVLFSACSLHKVKKEEIVISGKPLSLVTDVYLNTFGTYFSGTVDYSAIGDFNGRNGWRTQTATARFAYPEILTKEVKKTIQKAFENEITPLNPTRKGHSFALELSFRKGIHQTHHQVDTASFTYNNKKVPSNTYLVVIHGELCYRFLSPDGRLIASGITTGEGKGRSANWGFSANLFTFECAYKAAFEVAVHEASMKLVNELVTSPEINAEIRKIHLLKTLPANLIVGIDYTDKASLIPNNTIDACEDSLIIANITNEGKGTAFDVTLNTETNFKNIDFEHTIALGDIQPAGSKEEVKINIKAGLNLEDGTAPFFITCKEKRGYDSKTYTLNVPTAHVDKPEIEILITNTKEYINDGTTGFASGNGNGIPENGETIEIIPFVKNNGVGSAIDVNLSIASINRDINIKKNNVIIPQILSGQAIKSTLVFTIPTTFSGGDIDVDLRASDTRGVSNFTKIFTIKTETHQPVLAYDYDILDRSGKRLREGGCLKNGDQGTLVITPDNKGKIDAQDITINLQSDSISFSKAHAEIDRIAANSKYMDIFQTLIFPFSIPRNVQKEPDVHIQFTQKDFQGLSNYIHIPITIIKPEFTTHHRIREPNENEIIERGESIELIIQIQNTGALDAENVVLNLNADQRGTIQKGVVLNSASNKEINIGRLPAHGESEELRFLINVRREADIGRTHFKFTISHKDFGSIDLPLIFFDIDKEKPEEKTIKPDPKKSFPIVTTSHPPVIIIDSPENSEKIVSESVSLKGMVADDKGVAKIEVKVNGKLINISDKNLSLKSKTGQYQKKQDFDFDIQLVHGKNDITVTAYNIQDIPQSKSITVLQESERGEIWAAVIGINRYKDEKLNLNYAKDDAKAFAEYLRNNMGLDENHLFELYDEEATTENIKSLLGTKLRDNAYRSEDTVFIFFAGHGLSDKKRTKNNNSIEYFASHDSDQENICATAMPMDDIPRIFSLIKSKNVIFIIDCCHSGATVGRTSNIYSFFDQISKEKGRIILTSCRPDEVSKEAPELKHGYFTYYLLEGLNGKADYDKDNIIDIDEIYNYLIENVPKATNKNQNPLKKGDTEGRVVMGRIKRENK